MKTRKEKLIEEVSLSELAFKNFDLALSKVHLGRAHILSQKSVWLHLYVHYLMLKFSLRVGELKEVGGQCLRLLVTIPGHLLGKVPQGNTGWSTVGLIESMPVPEDLKEFD